MGKKKKRRRRYKRAKKAEYPVLDALKWVTGKGKDAAYYKNELAKMKAKKELDEYKRENPTMGARLAKSAWTALTKKKKPKSIYG